MALTEHEFEFEFKCMCALGTFNNRVNCVTPTSKLFMLLLCFQHFFAAAVAAAAVAASAIQRDFFCKRKNSHTHRAVQNLAGVFSGANSIALSLYTLRL